jgi:hypothetical protein
MSLGQLQEQHLQQQQLINGFGGEATSARQHDATTSGSEPLLQSLSPSESAVDRSPGPASPLTSTITSATGGQQTRPAGGSRSLSTGSRPKACSVHIVEPLPTFSGGRGSRASLGAGYTVVKSEEKHGILQRAIPVMPLGLAIVACVLNIVLPGVGKYIV